MSDKNFSFINLPDLPDSVDNAVQNLTDKPTLGIGQTLADAWYLVFSPITQAANKRRMKYARELEIYNHELSSAIEAIPEENLVEPSIQITAQALENSKYCIDSEDLRKMFVNLISKSMDKCHISNVHPSFAEIIKQMSPVDAHVLKALYPASRFPVVDYVIKYSRLTYRLLLPNVYVTCSMSLNLESLSTSISSLKRLGIIDFNRQACITNDEVYIPFKENEYYQNLLRSNPSEEVELKKYLGFFTPLGKNFCEICVK